MLRGSECSHCLGGDGLRPVQVERRSTRFLSTFTQVSELTKGSPSFARPGRVEDPSPRGLLSSRSAHDDSRLRVFHKSGVDYTATGLSVVAQFEFDPLSSAKATDSPSPSLGIGPKNTMSKHS